MRGCAKLRTKFLHLPVFARGELVHRARVRHPELAGGRELTWEGLYVWTQTCPDEELIAKLPGVIAAGRAVSLGQLRENGNTSAPHVEPMIMGEFLRLKPVGEPANTRKSIHQGGHPADLAVDALVADLTLLWLEATGAPPRNSRVRTTSASCSGEGRREVAEECATAVLGLCEASQGAAEQHSGRLRQAARLLHG